MADGYPVVQRGSKGIGYKFLLSQVRAWRAQGLDRKAADEAARLSLIRQQQLKMVGVRPGNGLADVEDGLEKMFVFLRAAAPAELRATLESLLADIKRRWGGREAQSAGPSCLCPPLPPFTAAAEVRRAVAETVLDASARASGQRPPPRKLIEM